MYNRIGQTVNANNQPKLQTVMGSYFAFLCFKY